MPINLHEQYMEIAIKYASNNPVWPFATLLVDQNGKILLKSINQVEQSPTYHAEIVAINEFSKKFPNFNMSELTLYTTGEPCTMCAGAICWASIPTVIYGSSVPFLSKLWGIEIGIRAQEIFDRNQQTFSTKLIGPVLEEKCNNYLLMLNVYRKKFMLMIK